MNSTPFFSYDYCTPDEMALGTIDYHGCVLQARIWPYHPGDMFDWIAVDYHAREVRLYDSLDDAVPVHVARMEFSLG